MGKLDRANGQFYADNVIDYLLYFENSQTWTASSGTGTATLDNTLAFTGSNSLRIENTDPTNDLDVTNSAQSTVIGVGGDYQFSYFVRKDDTGVTYTGHVEIFKGGSTYYTQAFSIDEDETWIRIVNDAPLSFLKSDEVTIKIQLDGVSGYANPSTVLNIDGIMLNLNERQNGMPPQYVMPIDKTIYRIQNESGQPTISDDQFTFWMADAGGTLDSTTYETGDVLLTVNSGGTQKTVIIADFSAL